MSTLNVNNNKIVTLVGSTKFKNEFRKYEKEFTLKGYIVLTIHVFSHADGDILDDDTLVMLNGLHLRKIELAEKIFVINKDGYIGKSTDFEIAYAKARDIPVEYMNPIKEEEKEI